MTDAPRKKCKLPHAVELLKMFGWGFGLELDGELVITPPATDDTMQPHRVLYVLNQCTVDIANHVYAVAASERRQFVGGPLNGQRHQRFGHGYDSHPIPMRIGRAHWAAYDLVRDGRALFRGFATSEKKARQLVYQLAAKKEQA